jgi:hypothetical protein
LTGLLLAVASWGILDALVGLLKLSLELGELLPEALSVFLESLAASLAPSSREFGSTLDTTLAPFFQATLARTKERLHLPRGFGTLPGGGPLVAQHAFVRSDDLIPVRDPPLELLANPVPLARPMGGRTAIELSVSRASAVST